MFISFCKSKLAHGRITEAQLLYEGSITIDGDLIKAAGLIPGQQVVVLNVNNGNRFETYVIKGEAGSGAICLNGPAARLGLIGDQVIILGYALMSPEEAREARMTVVNLDEHNRIRSQK